MSVFSPFQLLELNIISAQELAPLSRRMKTYAVAWVHSERKLTTRVDYTGGANPTWNDKFVFRLNEEFLYSDTSAVMIEVYALHWLRDVHVGTVRVLISNLIPLNHRPGYRNNNNLRHTPPLGMRFVALQVRRPSGRPQGILNIGVGLLDGSMRSMPLYTHMDSSAVGYRDLLGEEDPHLQHLSHKTSSRNPQSPSSKQFQSIVSRPKLRRTKSDASSLVVSDLLSRAERSRIANKQPASSLASSESDTITTSWGHDTTSDSDTMRNTNAPTPNRTRQKLKKRYEPMDSEIFNPPRRGKSEMPRLTPKNPTKGQTVAKDYNRGGASPYLSKHGKPLRSNIVGSTPIRSINIVGSTPIRSYLEFGTPMRSNLAGRPILTESELGPSPSEAAAQMAKDRAQGGADAESSIISEWSVDDSSIEGLRTKLERWRTELPPLYDFGSSHLSSDLDGAAAGGRSSYHKTPVGKKHRRRHTDGGNGLFSCFSNICGWECTLICGSDPDGSKQKKNKEDNVRVHRTASTENLSFL